MKREKSFWASYIFQMNPIIMIWYPSYDVDCMLRLYMKEFLDLVLVALQLSFATEERSLQEARKYSLNLQSCLFGWISVGYFIRIWPYKLAISWPVYCRSPHYRNSSSCGIIWWLSASWHSPSKENRLSKASWPKLLRSYELLKVNRSLFAKTGDINLLDPHICTCIK